ncbi:3-oxoacyl-(acyl-carrier-protein) synthase [Salegentibacter sp. 24]|uniref:beta-ketoacyl synthase chain length factor n=1 Tax=Salegentibacter sp. 24 TaxID=2183986 RepID=UPI001060DC97|nr:beta-ketoacyl synthase chain length factor [Salegentibacter sp. 24]TDN89428.1 3-oxoacyl-(acyl-carrier-protein) synthase [Salegentibacter sp. 24]
MQNKIYINGLGSISAQPEDLISGEAIRVYDENIFSAISPNYKKYINLKAFRRMSKGIKMGITAAQIALKEAEIDMPDSIITGTGEGCKLDTEKFLENLLDQNEKLLSPTAFIQSTHNTIGGQIALNLGCKQYNITYTQNSVSLETAFLDAQIQLREDPEMKVILVGGVDEVSARITSFRKLDGQLKQNPIKNIDLLKVDSQGTITSEGAHFFALSKEKNQKTYAEFQSVSIKNSIQPEEVTEEITAFLKIQNVNLLSIDAVILGVNGDNRYDHYYKDIQLDLFKNTPQLAYKHLVGDFDTASGFAVYLGANILKSGKVLEVLRLNQVECRNPRTILIYNQYLGRDHSLILLSAV